MAKGFVYVAQNSSILGLLKIGRTEKVPTVRLAELFTTGVPEPFDVAYYALVQDSKKAEKQVHELLDRYRHKENREFFAISVGAAIRAIQAIEPPEHEFQNQETHQLESLNSLIDLDSRHFIESEEKQLEEFAQAIQDNDLHPFVLSAFYDSNACICQFTLADCVKESSPLADEIMAIALKTIGQFEWFGCIYHGRGIDDLEF